MELVDVTKCFKRSLAYKHIHVPVSFCQNVMINSLPKQALDIYMISMNNQFSDIHIIITQCYVHILLLFN